MHYEFRIVHDTHVRASLREGWIHQMHGFSQQLRIMHYELRINTYRGLLFLGLLRIDAIKIIKTFRFYKNTNYICIYKRILVRPQPIIGCKSNYLCQTKKIII